MANRFHCILSALALAVSGCANLNTVDRETALPRGGKAVHLDIQQRLLISNDLGNYCAEPSPDGLAAFAAALGVSASNPASQAVSVSGSGNSNAASIGLRSQTITVMRDAMYRVCEAYNNEFVGEAQVPVLLGRSQDLTAVILAIEQLTGPVTAQQVALMGTTDASASASLVAIAEQLELALKQVERANERLEDATTKVTELETKLAAVDLDLSAQKAKHEKFDNDTPAETRQRTELEIGQLAQEKASLEGQLESAKKTVELRTAALKSATDTRDTIQQKQDTAFASASSGTSGDSRFGGQTGASPLGKEAAVEVAGAVKDMVLEVLKKDYLDESCLSVLTLPTETRARIQAATSKTQAQGKPKPNNRKTTSNSGVAPSTPPPANDSLDPITTSCIGLVQATLDMRRAEAALKAAEAKERAAQVELAAAETSAKASLVRSQTPSNLDKLMACLTSGDGSVDTAKRDALLNAIPASDPGANLAGIARSKSEASKLRTYLASSPALYGSLLKAAVAPPATCPSLVGSL